MAENDPRVKAVMLCLAGCAVILLLDLWIKHDLGRLMLAIRADIDRAERLKGDADGSGHAGNSTTAHRTRRDSSGRAHSRVGGTAGRGTGTDHSAGEAGFPADTVGE